MKPEKPDACITCKRSVFLNFHHLVPKKMHSKRPIQKLHADKELDHYGIWVCTDCHKKIHKLFDHKTLAESYYRLDQIMANEKFRKFVSWVRKQKKRVK